MMRVSGYVKDSKDFSKGCVIGDDPPLDSDHEWKRFEAITSPVGESYTGYMVIEGLWGYIRICPWSYSTVSAYDAEHKCFFLGKIIGAAPVRVVLFGDD